MSTGELLNVEPLELKFPFELKKQISCSLQLLNKTDNHVAFKVKTTNPKKYCVRPNTGVVMPRSTSHVIVTMQAQKEAPPDMHCKDKFLLQNVVASPGVSPKDITSEMFSKKEGRVVEECKLKVIYLPPPQPPSPVLEEPDEGASPKVSFADTGNRNISELVSRQYADSDDNSSEVRSLISQLTDEKNAAVLQSKKIRQEMEMLTCGGNNKRQRGGVSIIFVILLALIGLVMGYFMKN